MIIEVATWIMYFVSTYYAVFLLLIILDKGLNPDELRVKDKRASTWRPFVTVAIPAYNEEETIEATINSVLALHYPKDKMDIIVVNDCSTDNTRHVLEQIRSQHSGIVRVLHQPVNRGKGAALNLALDHARGEIFICLDADSFVQPNTLLTMLPHFYGNKDVASVLPFMKITKTNNFMLKIQWVEYLMNFFLKRIVGMIDCIHVTPGPFACYRRDVLRKVGRFDEHNLTEDLEMAVRLQKYDYRIIQLLDAEVVTVAPETFTGFYKQRNRWYKGTLHNLYKHRDLLFNAKYGEFGIYHLPMVFVAAMLSLSFAFLIIYHRLIQPILTKLYDLSFINFNVPLMMKIGAHRFSLLDLNYTMLYLTVVVFAFALIWIVGSHRYSKENYVSKGLWPSFLFLSVYPLILSAVWAGVFYDVVRRKKQKW